MKDNIHGDRIDKYGRFEVIMLEPCTNKLVHLFRDSYIESSILGRPPGEWRLAEIISKSATSPGSIIQSHFPDQTHGNFEVVVIEGNSLVHYWYDNSNPNGRWQRNKDIISTKATGPASIIQSDFPNQSPCNFEVVALEEGNYLVHHWRDNTSNPPGLWQVGETISTKATGPGCIIQSDFKSRDRYGVEHGNFELVVPEGNRLVWYQRRWDKSSWDFVGTISTKATGPGCIIKSDFKENPRLVNHNFEVVVPEGNNLVHYWHDNIDIRNPWNRAPEIVSTSASGPGCIIKTNFKTINIDNNNKRSFPTCQLGSNFTVGNEGNFDVVVQECSQSVTHYWRISSIRPWERDFFIILSEPYYHPITHTRKIAQLTGDTDLSTETQTMNQTGNKYKIYGTDLGSSFLHNEKIYFLFGDTRSSPPCGQPPGDDLWDRIVYTSDPNPSDESGISLQYEGIPVVNNICQQGSEIPVEGISFGEYIYVFFATDSDNARYSYSTRSVVARSNGSRIIQDREKIDFGNPLYTFSKISGNHGSGKFINVSIEIIKNNNLRDYIPRDLADIGEDGLLIWGSGRFRASDVYLAYMPLKDIGRPTSTGEKPSSIRYFSGYDNQNNRPNWKKEESDAIPLFCSGCVGELSVRWNEFIRKWIIMYNSDNPRGIVLRASKKPWGQWSSPMVIFDPWNDKGLGYFIHWPDHDSISELAPDGEEHKKVWGGEYGPYQIGPYSVGLSNNNCTRIYFTMSTWNPYQVVLMSTVICNRDIIWQ
jgi:hypothetical protein